MYWIYGLFLLVWVSVVMVEFCIGGLIVKCLIDQVGLLQYFFGLVVVYQNDIKIVMLGVEDVVFESKGVVLWEVCEVMVLVVRDRFFVIYGFLVIGIVGLEGGSEQKFVGFVYIGFVGLGEDFCYLEKKIFFGGCEFVCVQIVICVLDFLWWSFEGLFF